MIKLSWKNYQQLQKEIDEIKHKSFFSALTMLSWLYYGINVEYKIDYIKNNKVVFLFGKFNNLINSIEDGQTNPLVLEIVEDKDHFIIMPLYDENSNLTVTEVIVEAYLHLDKKYPFKSRFAVHGINQEQLSTLPYHKNYKLIYTWKSNYIYFTEKMKTLAGKKLQKRRNHLNYFDKVFSKSIIINSINKNDYNDILSFCIKMRNKRHESTSLWNELLFLRKLFENWDNKKMTGSVLRTRSKNELIGFTIGYYHNNIYEIFAEKADYRWRGAYQYLMTQNLKINQIQSIYIDRQDDSWSENIVQSKEAYFPEKVVELNMIYSDCEKLIETLQKNENQNCEASIC